MPVNRFTVSKRLTEQQFVGIACDLILGLTPEATSDRIAVSTKTVRRYQRLMLSRLVEEFRLGVSLSNLDKETWNEIYKCMFKCPNNIHTTYEYDEIDEKVAQSASQIERGLKTTKLKKLKRCHDCKLKEPFELPELLQFKILHIARTMHGFSVDAMEEVFCLAFLWNHFRLPSEGGSNDPMGFVTLLLESCVDRPL